MGAESVVGEVPAVECNRYQALGSGSPPKRKESQEYIRTVKMNTAMKISILQIVENWVSVSLSTWTKGA